MINIKLKGIVPHIKSSLDQLSVDDKGNLIVIIHQVDRHSQPILKIFFKSAEYYEQVPHSIVLRVDIGYFQPRVWQGSQNNLYYFLIDRWWPHGSSAYCLDVQTMLITMIYHNEQTKYVSIVDNQLIDMHENGDFIIISNDQAPKTIFKNVKEMNFIPFKEIKLLVITTHDGQDGHYIWPEIKKITFTRGQRLNKRNEILFIDVIENETISIEQQRILKGYVQYYQRPDGFKDYPYPKSQHFMISSRMVQMRPRQKILRRFNNLDYPERMNHQLLYISNKLDEQYIHTIADIRNAKQEVIFNQYKIQIVNKIALELRDYMIWVYQLEY